MNLRQLEINKTAVVMSVGGDGALRQHFLDMGIIPGVEVFIVKFAPRGDPMEVRLHGYELTLRLADAEKIEVMPASEYMPAQEKGMTGQIHSLKAKQNQEKAEDRLPEDAKLTFALMGNQNCGKTTLFNQLTGSKQHVGNFRE